MWVVWYLPYFRRDGTKRRFSSSLKICENSLMFSFFIFNFLYLGRTTKGYTCFDRDKEATMSKRSSSIYKNSLTANRREGQFVVNLAEILVSTGLVIGAVFQAQLFLQDYQFESYYDELKGVETALWEYKAVTGYWPGDCDEDGVIDIGMSDGTLQASNNMCAYDVRSQEAMLKVFTDLASANMLDDNLRAKFADEKGQYMQLAHGAAYGAEAKNMLVAFDVTVELAQWLDEKIDGVMAADAGRIRRWGGRELQGWPAAEKVDVVSIAYYFDSKI